MVQQHSHASLDQEIGSLADLSIASLRARWRELFKVEPAARLSRDLLSRAIAHRLQERAQGGLGKKAKRQIAKHTKELGAHGAVSVPSPLNLKPGTKLFREWRGRTHQVEVLVDGFTWEGNSYRSLSQIARKITGTRWSGPRFFGVGAAYRPSPPGSNPAGKPNG